MAAPHTRIRARVRSGSNVGRLLAIAAHDLKNPISGILGGSEYLLEDAGHCLETEHVAVLESIAASARHMISLIDDLVAISEIESEQFQLRSQPKNFARTVRAAVAHQRDAAELKNLRIHVEADPALPPIDLDGTRMNRAIQSLLKVGIASAPVGGAIAIRVGLAERSAVLSIESNLAGDPVREKSRHTMGIALAERIAAIHGGSLKAVFESSRRAAFVLTLPLSANIRSRNS